jgi:hypothetical protein
VRWQEGVRVEPSEEVRRAEGLDRLAALWLYGYDLAINAVIVERVLPWMLGDFIPFERIFLESINLECGAQLNPSLCAPGGDTISPLLAINFVQAI